MGDWVNNQYEGTPVGKFVEHKRKNTENPYRTCISVCNRENVIRGLRFKGAKSSNPRPAHSVNMEYVSIHDILRMNSVRHVPIADGAVAATKLGIGR